jgi:hypothetical protein
MAENERINQITQFLEQRADLENVSGLERIEFLKEQEQLILESENLTNEERLSATKAVNAEILKEEQKLANEKSKLQKSMLSASSDFFGAMSSLLDETAKDNREAAVAQKILSAAQAAINSYLAFTQALASVPFPANIVAAAAVLATGIATQVKILSTPIPSAETGGTFIVPQGRSVDDKLYAFNGGEEVNVTPRGMTNLSGSQNITVQIDKQVIFDVVNDGIRSNDILIEAVNY